MTDKRLLLVLHSHIPFVLFQGSWPHGVDWLYEAAAETYLPLLNVFRRLVEEGISPSVNIGLTPVLAEQLKHPGFREGFQDYLKMKADWAARDLRYFEESGNTRLSPLARWWKGWYEGLAEDFMEKYGSDIVQAFRQLQDEGHVEILTSAATHAYFPLLSRDESILWQIRQGRSSYKRHFGREPRGFWLPECAYRPGYAWKEPVGKGRVRQRKGVDVLLEREGLHYFFVDSHLLRGGEAMGVYHERFPALKAIWERSRRKKRPGPRKEADIFRPHRAHPSGTAFFARDDISGKQVWSRGGGYPGEGLYLEFHKKHYPGGMRYWRITSSETDLAAKAVYEPEKVRGCLENHAEHFIALLEQTLKKRDTGVVTAMYDTELFGHWWFEGPEWLYLVLKKMDSHPVLKPAQASECLATVSPDRMIALPEGSWGEGGFHWIWMNQDTTWIWEKIYHLEEEAVRAWKKRGRHPTRVWKQFLREKLLLESSDWPFLVTTWTARDYAENRAARHYEKACRLLQWLKKDSSMSSEEEWLLSKWEAEDGLFEDLVDL